MIELARKRFPEYNDMADEQLLAALHQKFYSDMPEEEFMQRCGCPRPDHEDLTAAAVTGADSLDLQELDPEVKPAVKMTFAELVAEGQKRRLVGKISLILADGTAYVIDPQGGDPKEAIEAILEGEDSGPLGYPEKGPCDCAVTKQGEVVTDLARMKQEAQAGNVAWAANGNEAPLMEKATAVSRAITGRKSVNDGRSMVKG